MKFLNPTCAQCRAALRGEIIAYEKKVGAYTVKQRSNHE